jgi:hypothetical protein
MIIKTYTKILFILVAFITLTSFQSDVLGLYNTLSIVGRGIEPDRAIKLMKDEGFQLDTAWDLPAYHIYNFSKNEVKATLTTFTDYRENSWIRYSDKDLCEYSNFVSYVLSQKNVQFKYQSCLLGQSWEDLVLGVEITVRPDDQLTIGRNLDL